MFKPKTSKKVRKATRRYEKREHVTVSCQQIEGMLFLWSGVHIPIIYINILYQSKVSLLLSFHLTSLRIFLGAPKYNTLSVVGPKRFEGPLKAKQGMCTLEDTRLLRCDPAFIQLSFRYSDIPCSRQGPD